MSAPLLEPLPDEPGRWRGTSALCGAGALGCSLGAIAVYSSQIAEALDVLLNWCMRLGWSAAVLIAVGTAVLNVLMLPTFPFMVGAPALFTKMYGPQVGTLLGAASVFSGLWVGSMAAFLLGRTLLREFARKELDSHAMFGIINGMIDAEGLQVVLLSRMSPLLPAEVFNYACSMTTLTSYQYAVGCLGSLVPVSFWSFTAAQTASVASGRGSTGGNSFVMIAINVVIMALLTAMLCSAYKQYKSKAQKVIDEKLKPKTPKLRESMTRELCHVYIHPGLMRSKSSFHAHIGARESSQSCALQLG